MTRKTEKKQKNYDIIVIGAGSGGLTMAAVSAQLGYRVALLEGGKMGGDCLNYGCVPSKALIAAAHKAHAINNSGAFGIKARGKADMKEVHAHIRKTIATIAPHDSQERFEGLGVDVIREYGFFINANTVGTEGGMRLKGRRIVIATGSRPLVPNIKGLEAAGYLTNETVFDLKQTPEHLLIAGGGPIGVEMAQAFARLGSKVTLIEGSAQILGQEDLDIAKAVREQLAHEGVEVITGYMLSQVSRKEGKYSLTLSKNGQVKKAKGTALLVALGRQPNTEKLELENAGVALDGRTIKVDRSLRTTGKNIYAVGDVAGPYQFTHMAGFQAAHVIKRVLFGAFWAKINYNAVPWVTYTDPEVATVGLNETAARKKYGGSVKATKTDFTQNDRAQAAGQTRGFIKLVTRKGKLLGVTIYGPHAGELIGIWTLALGQKLKLSAISGMIHPYPTLNDISRQVVSDYFKPTFLSRKVRRLSRVMFRLFG